MTYILMGIIIFLLAVLGFVGYLVWKELKELWGMF